MMKYFSPLPDRYCPVCGEKLSNEYVFQRYDEDTGERLFHVRSYCSKTKWYNRHSNYFRGDWDDDGETFYHQIAREKICD